jgi:hypothetical protein
MRRSHLFVVCSLCLLTFSKPHAQSSFKNASFAIQGYYGSFLTHLPKAQYLRDSYSYFGELSISRQTDGQQDWQLANGLPQVGVALFYGNTGSRRYIGRMGGVFPFVAWRLYNTNGFKSSFRAGAGIGLVEKPYNKISNHKNVLVGSYGNAYIHFLWQNDVRLYSGLHLTAGFSFSHFSNGSSSLPNLGLNIPALSIGLRYSGVKDPRLVKRKLDPLNKNSTFTILTTAGLKQFPWIESQRYLVNTVQLEWARRFRHSARYSGGAVLFYDRALEVNPAGILDQKRKGNKLQAGIYAGYEHLLGRLSVPVQLGLYVHNRDIYSALFQQLGFRYRITSQWSAQLAMKTHSGKADFIHLGVGYQIK